jgi:3'-phosphoadenosine 5'-phosphosulfate sulfotransferase (PAPS reductase)/FAD synthetase
MRRWCTSRKVDTINNYLKQDNSEFETYIGFAADEVKRTGCGNACQGEEKNGFVTLYPLIFDWDMDEAECLQYCYNRGFDWGGLYKHFNRVSCFCCPLQRLGELRILRKSHPELWKQMLEWDTIIDPNKGFYGYKTVRDLDRRFAGAFDIDFK